MLRDAGESVREARSQQAETRIVERRLATEYESLLDKSADWEGRAELALRAGDESLARRALDRKYQLDRRADVIKKQLDEQRAHLIDLDRSLQAVRVKLEGLREHGRTARPARSAGTSSTERRTSRLEAEAELGLLGEPELFDQFDDMADRLAFDNATAAAETELGARRPPPRENDLESRFRALEADRSLKQIKARKPPLDDLRRRLDEE